MIKNSKNIFKTAFSTWNIEEHKPTPTQRKAQEGGVMSKKIMLQKYQLLKSQPTDNLDQITSNYMQLKKIYNNRRYYIPDKKNYLFMLDQCYSDILQVHEDYNYLELGKDSGLINKSQTLTYELKVIRTAQLLALLQTYEMAGIILVLLSFILIFKQQSNAKSKRVKIWQHFSLSSTLNKLINDFHANKWKSYLEGKKKQIVSAQTLKRFQKRGTEFDYTQHGMESILELKKKAEQKLGSTQGIQDIDVNK